MSARRIYAWMAARSGATMTLKGRDENGERLVICNVDKIWVSTEDEAVFASTRSGESFVLDARQPPVRQSTQHLQDLATALALAILAPATALALGAAAFWIGG